MWKSNQIRFKPGSVERSRQKRVHIASGPNLRGLKYFLRFGQLKLPKLRIFHCYSKKNDKTDGYYTLKEILYSILLMEPSIEPEKNSN
jgi:hypothetical protein